MKIGDEVYIHGFVDEIRQNVIIIRNDGGYFGTVAEEITSCSEIPNTCGDAISRQAVLDIINFEDKWLLGAKSHNVDTKTAFWTMKSKIFNLPSVTPEPCEDAISRQAVMDCFKKWQPYMATRLFEFEKELSEIPSVSPQQKMGRWINAEVLDNIRAEIMDFEEELFHRPNTDYSDYAAVRHCVEIIDKYKAESEDKDADSD